ncbi:unnamed protein product [Blepharisma stoltei]|uniref:Trimethylguanosine synthase n=1 Tax=Blepharisma stoltei TaxID=1481888 RepID=A0AAU9IQX1_9CILI|nr:unnamed protein product [Blepharisma stoltei]
MRRIRTQSYTKHPSKKARKNSGSQTYEEILLNINLDLAADFSTSDVKHAQSEQQTIKDLPCFIKLKQGTQLIGTGKNTTIVIMDKIFVLPDSPKPYPNKKSKPDEVPMKYWSQRYSIFSKFDEGIKLDEESWYSATHEPIAKHIAKTCEDAEIIMDGFSGAGGNVVHFAKTNKVIAIELDPKKIELLRNNAEVYGVSDMIQYTQGDFLEVAENFGYVDVIFMSPPWGGPEYLTNPSYDLFKSVTPDIKEIMKICEKITKNVILYLPRNSDPDQMIELLDYAPSLQRQIEIQLYYYGSKVKTIGLFIGDMVHPDYFEVATLLLHRNGSECSFMEAMSLSYDMETEGFNEIINRMF